MFRHRPSILNKYIQNFKFQMETAASISAAVRSADWAISLDLKDAFFHVPIAPWFRRYLRFSLGSRVYQFRTPCFGLSTAPRVFTRVCFLAMVFLHDEGSTSTAISTFFANLTRSIRTNLEQFQVVSTFSHTLASTSVWKSRNWCRPWTSPRWGLHTEQTSA